MKLNTLLGGTLSVAMATLGGMAAAEYPEKPVSFVVPFPPGDLEDVLTRMIAEDFQTEYGVSAAVVNKPGGGGGPFPGAIEVANAPADGYTIGSFVIGVPVVGHQIGIALFLGQGDHFNIIIQCVDNILNGLNLIRQMRAFTHDILRLVRIIP